MENIVIIGVGGFGREVKVLIDQINKIEKKYTILGFYDDAIDCKSHYNGIPFLGTIDHLNQTKNSTAVALGIGDPATKTKIIKRLNNNKVKNVTLRSPD